MATEVPRERRAYEFRDGQGRQARAWWGAEGWRVEAGDPAFRQRIVRALRQPISVWETAVWADGVPSCAPVQVAPGDPRYLGGLPMAWGQLPLDDVDIDVVPFQDEAG
jgi:hypothetical protein